MDGEAAVWLQLDGSWVEEGSFDRDDPLVAFELFLEVRLERGRCQPASSAARRRQSCGGEAHKARLRILPAKSKHLPGPHKQQ